MEELIISRKDLEHNINIVKNYIIEHSNGKIPKIIGVVKANGYGMGLVELSNEYINQGIDMLAVSNIEEAVKLRQNNIYCDILLLSSTSIEKEARVIVENNIIPTIGSIESLKIYNKIAKENNDKIDVHIKIETGFSRYGVKLEQIPQFIADYSKCENINIAGVFTHFTQSFAKESISVDRQYNIYMEAVSLLKNNIDFTNVMLHICNSSAVFKYPKYYLDAVRVGSAFIGSLPFANNYGLIKVGYLSAQVSEIKNIPKGSTVGYGQSYVAKDDMSIAIVQSGYTSGIGLQIENNTNTFMNMLRQIKKELLNYIKKRNSTCIINGNQYNIISNIRMNNIFIDITNSDVKVGDSVIIKVYPALVDSSIKRMYI